MGGVMNSAAANIKESPKPSSDYGAELAPEGI
jgi:hypothetical protein